jgi:hypothetical protein
MQPGDKSKQIERARNEVDLGVLGDPERWGGIADFSLDIPRQIGIVSVEVYSTQVIRVQCADLIARSWDLLVNWHLEGTEPQDTIVRCGFEVTLGVGQASRRMVLDLLASVQGYSVAYGNMPNVAWEYTIGNGGITDGTVQLRWCLPAVAFAGRFVLGVQSGITPLKDGIPGPIVGPIPIGGGHTITGTCFAAVSPRSL